ncbi:MAG: DUF427 domain-containing protein [Pseudomonadota bacterium]
MADHIRIVAAQGTWVVRAGGAVIGESAEALELLEGDYPAVIYFPRGDIATAFLEQSTKVTHCPWKGDATHYAVVTGDRHIADAAWSYLSPKDGMERIAGHIAFYTNVDDVAVEQL